MIDDDILTSKEPMKVDPSRALKFALLVWVYRLSFPTDVLTGSKVKSVDVLIRSGLTSRQLESCYAMVQIMLYEAEQRRSQLVDKHDFAECIQDHVDRALPLLQPVGGEIYTSFQEILQMVQSLVEQMEDGCMEYEKEVATYHLAAAYLTGFVDLEDINTTGNSNVDHEISKYQTKGFGVAK